MERIEYDKNGIWIPFEVSKENPCPVCEAQVNTAHCGYCPNTKYQSVTKVKQNAN